MAENDADATSDEQFTALARECVRRGSVGALMAANLHTMLHGRETNLGHVLGEYGTAYAQACVWRRSLESMEELASARRIRAAIDKFMRENPPPPLTALDTEQD